MWRDESTEVESCPEPCFPIETRLDEAGFFFSSGSEGRAMEASRKELIVWMVIGLAVSIPFGMLTGILIVDIVANGIGWTW
jgi:hypothetical protein